MNLVFRSLVSVGCVTLAAMGSAGEEKTTETDSRRAAMRDAWRRLPVPPITPYSGMFGDNARAFVGKIDTKQPAMRGFYVWKKEASPYDPAKDPRPINRDFEQAQLEDWRRMGYNCAYKGNAFTWRIGRFLKANGMLGAIDQTLWGSDGPTPLLCDGRLGPQYRESCGSYFAPENVEAGVEVLSNFARNYGDLDMFQVGGTSITCSWDEVGMRSRNMFDYRPEAVAEYRRFLQDVWFQDGSPADDTNRDGRTYNQFTGQHLTSWDQVQPPRLSRRFFAEPTAGDVREKWDHPGVYKLWVDFHRYFTFEFFRRVNALASARAARPVECYPFPQAFITWPGMNCFFGLSTYWNCRLNPIVCVEQCWPDSPAMSFNYAQTDRLAHKFGNVVMGWSWFFFGKEGQGMYDGPYDNGRALARMMGRRVDGIHHWLYSPIYRGRDQRQRLQIAYWHNFLAHHYATFLARSEPVAARAALLLPDWTGYFYRMFNYPVMDVAYTGTALEEAQIPYEVIFEEELECENGVLAPYKVLYVVGSEWTTPSIRRRIEEFIARGGVVCANVDSLSLDISTGRRTDFLEKTFGVKIDRKYKNSFLPSAQTAEEEEWSAQLNGWGKPAWLQGHNVHQSGVHAAIWKQEGDRLVPDPQQWPKLETAMAKMPAEVRGIRQSPLDMRDPPRVRYAEGVGPTAPTATWGEIDTATIVHGTPIAWYGQQICGAETDRTVWLGTRPGMDRHALSPRMSLNQTTEPCNPYVTQPIVDAYDVHRPYVDVVAYAARKAGIRRLVTITRDGQVPCNLEVLPRADSAGTLMVIVVNHDATAATYRVTVDPQHLACHRLQGVRAWNVLTEKALDVNAEGVFSLAIEPWRPAVFTIGTPSALAPIKEAQARLHAKDMSVPKYFLDRTKLNEYEYDTPVPEQ